VAVVAVVAAVVAAAAAAVGISAAGTDPVSMMSGTGFRARAASGLQPRLHLPLFHLSTVADAPLSPSVAKTVEVDGLLVALTCRACQRMVVGAAGIIGNLLSGFAPLSGKTLAPRRQESFLSSKGSRRSLQTNCSFLKGG
jgi:hypothetical protein